MMEEDIMNGGSSQFKIEKESKCQELKIIPAAN